MRIDVAQHLTFDMLESEYKKCKDGQMKIHLQAIRLLMQGRSKSEVARFTGLSRGWVREIVKRYNEHGLAGLTDGRAENGAKPLLSEEQRSKLLVALEGPAPDGGAWNGAKVCRWIRDCIGRDVDPKLGWVYLRRLGFTLERPRTAPVERTRGTRTRRTWVRASDDADVVSLRVDLSVPKQSAPMNVHPHVVDHARSYAVDALL